MSPSDSVAIEEAARLAPAGGVVRPRRALLGGSPALVVGAVLLAGWWIASRFAERLPSPPETVRELGRMAGEGTLFSILGRVALFMGICFTIAAIVGVSLGLLIGARPTLDRGLSPYLAALQGMPTGMWIPVAAVLLGTDVWSLGAVVALGAVPAIVLATRSAAKAIPPLLLRAGRTMGESGVGLLRRVVLPAALPGIATGLELGWSIAFRCLVAGEIFSGALSGTGIGTVIARSKETKDLTEMVATIMIVLSFSIAVDRLVFARIHHRLLKSRGLVDAGLPH